MVPACPPPAAPPLTLPPSIHLSRALSRSEMTALPSGRKTVDQGSCRPASIRAETKGAAAPPAVLLPMLLGMPPLMLPGGVVPPPGVQAVSSTDAAVTAATQDAEGRGTVNSPAPRTWPIHAPIVPRSFVLWSFVLRSAAGQPVPGPTAVPGVAAGSPLPRRAPRKGTRPPRGFPRRRGWSRRGRSSRTRFP